MHPSPGFLSLGYNSQTVKSSDLPFLPLLSPYCRVLSRPSPCTASPSPSPLISSLRWANLWYLWPQSSRCRVFRALLCDYQRVAVKWMEGTQQGKVRLQLREALPCNPPTSSPPLPPHWSDQTTEAEPDLDTTTTTASCWLSVHPGHMTLHQSYTLRLKLQWRPQESFTFYSHSVRTTEEARSSRTVCDVARTTRHKRWRRAAQWERKK